MRSKDTTGLKKKLSFTAVSTIFAYGQTGSGKTWTMMGGTEYVQGGITPRAIDFIFQEIEKRTDREWNIIVDMICYIEKKMFEI
jgi:hypothetical protein